jgi:hypothetical protein
VCNGYPAASWSSRIIAMRRWRRRWSSAVFFAIRLTPHPPAYVAHACVNVDEISKLAAAGAIVARARCQTSGWMLTLCML